MYKEIEIGDIQLWNSTIEDLKEQARHAKTLKARIRLAKSLNMARGYLKHAESKILVCLVLAILFCSGCQTVKGGLGDLSWGAKVLSDNIQVKE